ncbi:glycosyl hydrolase family 28-related protein [Polymorphospora sp. NPDC051019]|uniref:glycosyl hydrolase family 28-related protein n=1 Tax=Polymorphospora sp. NPDC051019 TaxID=3155725 RepID=UPI00342B7870
MSDQHSQHPRRPARRRRIRAVVAGSFVVALGAGTLGAHPALATADPPGPAGVETVAGLPPHLTAGRGATVPFVEQEAENAATTGEIIGPDRNAYTLPSEASGRRAVKLDAPGEWVEFTLTRDTNSLNVRYAVPDAEQGGGITGPLDVYLNNQRRHTITLTSEFSWLYSTYPFSNDPRAVPPDDWWIPEPRPVKTPFRPHHFYAEQRLLLGKTLHAGQKIKLKLPHDSTLPWAVIDLVDFEMVAKPKKMPRGALSVIDFGADPTGVRESADAFDAAVAAGRASGRTVFIPQGTYQVNRHVVVDDVTVTGAGNWHSVVRGDGVGFYGKWAADGGSHDVHLSDFAIIGNIRERRDDLQVNGIGGALGGGSTVERLYIQRTKVGMWFDGPFHGLTVRDNMIVDQMADGLNLRRGISGVRVTNNFLRNLGDDGLAMWSHFVKNPDGTPETSEEADQDHDNVYDHNTVIAPVLANGIAIYGGRDNVVSDNVVAETVREGGGLHAGYRHGSTRFSGTLTFARNTTVRAGVLDLNWNFGVGALWFYSLDGPMDARIDVVDNSFLDSTYSAIMAVKGHPEAHSVSNIHVDGACIDGAGTYALQLQVAGAGSFTGVEARNLGVGGTWRGDPFEITDGGGNSGWQNDIRWNWPMDTARPVAPPTNCA